jgi:hypothetical protein
VKIEQFAERLPEGFLEEEDPLAAALESQFEHFAKLPNPFSDEYVAAELEFYGHPKEVDGPVAIDYVRPFGPVPDFLNVQFRIGEFEVPRLIAGSTLWMTLTPMEVQSHFIPVTLAHGKVAVGGLGLGYAALRMASKILVEEVVVFEKDEKIIDWFRSAHAGRPEMAKIELVHGDAVQNIVRRAHEFDFAYVDTYEKMLEEQVEEDMKALIPIFHYRVHFWGQEIVLLKAIELGVATPDTFFLLEKWYFSKFMDVNRLRLSCEDLEAEMAMDILDLMGRPHE